MKWRIGLHGWIAFCALCCGAQSAPSNQFADLLKSGSAYAQQADYAHAIPLFRRAILLQPQDPFANFLLGQALLQSGHPADALPPLTIAANAPSVNQQAEGYLGDAAMELENFAMAAQTFQTAVERSPGSEQGLLWWTDFSLERYRNLTFSLRASPQGRAALIQTAAETGQVDFKSKVALLKQAVEMNPAIRGAWGELGIAQIAMDQDQAAEQSLANARQQLPDANSTWELEALVAAAHRDWAAAGSRLLALSERSPHQLQEILAAWPQRLVPDANVQGEVWPCLRKPAASCPLQAGRASQPRNIPAKQLFDEERWDQLIARPAPSADQVDAWFWRGLAMARLGDCQHAIPALEQGLKSGAETAASWLTYCYQLSAVQAADQLKHQGREGAVHEIRGNILLSIRLDAAKAIDEYKLALALKPNDPELLEKIAEACFSLGDMPGARQNAEQALALNPHRTQLLKLLAQVAISQRDYPAALSSLNQLAHLLPDDPWTQVEQATAYAQTGQPDLAAERLNQALNAGYPDNRGALHAMLAGLLRKLGRDQEARAASDQAIKLADAFQQQTEGKPDIPR